jgi:hypothetical protein
MPGPYGIGMDADFKEWEKSWVLDEKEKNDLLPRDSVILLVVST